MQLIRSSTNILNNTWQPLLTENTFIVQVSINLVLCSLKCKYIAVKCALSGIKSETQLHPQPYAENQSGHHIVTMTYIELRRSLWARKSHSFPTSKTRITMPARKWAAHWTVCNILHTRMGPLFLFTLLGPCLILGRECCFQVAFLGIVALNLPDYRQEFVLDLNCVCT
jgi:hypothetical protein